MKKTIFVTLMLQAVLIVAACDRSEQAPNSTLGNNFKSLYPNAKQIEWEMEDGYYVAEFRGEGHDKEAWFDRNNTWVLTKTEYEIRIPQIVKDALNQTNYKNWRIEDVDFIEIKGKNPFYIVEVEKGELEVDLYFSENGEFIKEIFDDGDYHREL